MRRTNTALFRRSVAALSGGNTGGQPHGIPHNDQLSPNMPWHVTAAQQTPPAEWKKGIMGKFLDQSLPLYDDVVRGSARVEWQEPCRTWHMWAYDETLVLEEHDKEEWNERPHIGVNHLYEPPVGSESRPMRVEGNGNPGDKVVTLCIGNCAPHVPDGTYLMPMRGYQVNQCPMCMQHFYVHNRPWLVMHPDWTDDPAADEGPAYTFEEVEGEFDRDFHEFALYLNAE
eukprot:PhM_4_TR1695/c0_g1_i1/m.19039